jgi:hypothetical protein
MHDITTTTANTNEQETYSVLKSDRKEHVEEKGTLFLGNYSGNG